MPKDRNVPIEYISKQLLHSMGVRVKKTMSGIKFVYRKEIVDELQQLGFSIDLLKVKGGELPLPVLREHVDEQASQEAYWFAQAEKARYEFSVGEDDYNFWYNGIYGKMFTKLQEDGVSKPTEKEVNAAIADNYPKNLKKRKEHLRVLERRYRMLFNCCCASIVTKGKMMQTLRNIIQGGNIKMASVDTEVIGGDLSHMKVQGA
jgi:hypothetical protein